VVSLCQGYPYIEYPFSEVTLYYVDGCYEVGKVRGPETYTGPDGIAGITDDKGGEG
jgi:hypothetical protein